MQWSKLSMNKFYWIFLLTNANVCVGKNTIIRCEKLTQADVDHTGLCSTERSIDACHREVKRAFWLTGLALYSSLKKFHPGIYLRCETNFSNNWGCDFLQTYSRCKVRYSIFKGRTPHYWNSAWREIGNNCEEGLEAWSVWKRRHCLRFSWH
jgi:hypothetical protein